TTTVGGAKIPETQGFFITDRIYFRDSVYLTGNERFMRFKGEVKVKVNNPFLKDSWFPFDDVVNPDSVYIPIVKSDLDKKKLTVGLHYHAPYRIFYNNFIVAKKSATEKLNDADLLLAEGVLTFDVGTREFKIGPEEKFNGKLYRGNIVSYDDSARVVTSQGYLNFPYAADRNTAKIEMAGLWREDQANQKQTTNLLMKIDFSVIPESARRRIYEMFIKFAAGNDFIDFEDKLLLESAAEFLDKDTIEAVTKDFINSIPKTRLIKDIKLAKLIPSTLLLSNVRFKWDDTYKALYLKDSVGLVGIGGVPFNRMISAKMDYAMGKTIFATGAPQTPDTLRIYIEADESNWVYFIFAQNTLKVVSSDNEGFNKEIRDLVAKQDKKKKDEKKSEFYILLGTEDDKDRFLNSLSRYK
ncbi:MAG: hypothetical protein NZ108_05765, partial [Bacteroidia bacterium]|nr:hypothetical protein [Bacteroidia bacterium]